MPDQIASTVTKSSFSCDIQYWGNCTQTWDVGLSLSWSVHNEGKDYTYHSQCDCDMEECFIVTLLNMHACLSLQGWLPMRLGTAHKQDMHDIKY